MKCCHADRCIILGPCCCSPEVGLDWYHHVWPAEQAGNSLLAPSWGAQRILAFGLCMGMKRNPETLVPRIQKTSKASGGQTSQPVLLRVERQSTYSGQAPVTAQDCCTGRLRRRIKLRPYPGNPRRKVAQRIYLNHLQQSIQCSQPSRIPVLQETGRRLLLNPTQVWKVAHRLTAGSRHNFRLQSSEELSKQWSHAQKHSFAKCPHLAAAASQGRIPTQPRVVSSSLSGGARKARPRHLSDFKPGLFVPCLWALTMALAITDNCRGL